MWLSAQNKKEPSHNPTVSLTATRKEKEGDECSIGGERVVGRGRGRHGVKGRTLDEPKRAHRGQVAVTSMGTCTGDPPTPDVTVKVTRHTIAPNLLTDSGQHAPATHGSNDSASSW